MKKGEFIQRYGERMWKRRMAQKLAWRKRNPQKVEATGRDQCRRGGSRYDKKLEYDRTGLRGERNKIRKSHRYRWSKYKRVIALGSQIHHEWYPWSSAYREVALVEANQHQHGIIDVIQILEGKVTLLTEREMRESERKRQSNSNHHEEEIS